MKKIPIRMRVNDKEVSIEVYPNSTLLYILRNQLNLTGTKEGCGIGECGACTVIVDGEAINSCLFLAPKSDGKEVWTVEGLGVRRNLHTLQRSFIEHGAVHCGFCIPGMLMSSKALLNNNPRPTREEIKQAISGNLCRCAGYQQVIEAIESIAKEGSNP